MSEEDDPTFKQRGKIKCEEESTKGAVSEERMRKKGGFAKINPISKVRYFWYRKLAKKKEKKGNMSGISPMLKKYNF